MSEAQDMIFPQITGVITQKVIAEIMIVAGMMIVVTAGTVTGIGATIMLGMVIERITITFGTVMIGISTIMRDVLQGVDTMTMTHITTLAMIPNMIITIGTALRDVIDMMTGIMNMTDGIVIPMTAMVGMVATDRPVM